MSQARDSAEIRRVILGLFAGDLAGPTNSGSPNAREETLRYVAAVNTVTRPLTLLEKKYLETRFPRKGTRECGGNLSDLPIAGG